MMNNYKVVGARSEHVRLLHALVELTTSPAQANRAPRVARQTLAALDALAAVFLRESGKGFEMVALHQRDRQQDAPAGPDHSQLEEVALRFAPKSSLNEHPSVAAN